MKSAALFARKVRLVRVFRAAGLFVASLLLVAPAVAQAQDASEQNRLFQQMVKDPKNHDITFAFAKVASARGDYEAAIGALERLLFYNPRLTRVKYELGSLYFRLRSYDMARRYFREALASPDVDAVTKQRIETYLPDADKQLQRSRVSGFVQAGIRSQSNASFSPTGNFLRLGGQDLSLLPTAQKRSDINAFELAGISHDYDLNTRGDVLETRFVGYLTQQDRLSQLNVGLFDISVGPRLQLAPEILPGVTIKPYLTGGNTWLGGRSYLSTGGAGVAVSVPLNDRLTFVPEFIWRRSEFNTNDIIPVSTFGTNDSYTGALSARTQLTQQITLDARGLYRRGEAAFAFQSFDQWAAEIALVFEFAPPSASISRNWSVAPFVKFINTRFDRPNPFIDPAVIHRDDQWSVGGILNTPFSGTFGWTTSVQYDKVDSTLPNFRLNNFSVMSGPTARF